jgi:hypothetical protein
MKPIFIAAAAVSVLAAGSAQAMNKCVMPDGSKVYSDQPCDTPALQAPRSAKPLDADKLPGLTVHDAARLQEVEAESQRRYGGARVMNTTRLGQQDAAGSRTAAPTSRR